MSRPYAPVDSDDGDGSSSRPNRLNEPCLGLCVRCCCCIMLTIPAVYLALSRNYNCDPNRLEALLPPYGGELMPETFELRERRSWFQWTKLVDVYTSNNTHIGYFYDMHFLLFMRFGFSDANDEIWFEAKYSSFLARLGTLGDQYYLQRCDVGAGGRHGHVYDVKEQWWSRSWFCWSNCVKRFEVYSRIDRGVGSEYDPRVADVLFNSTLDWYSGTLGLPKSRHRWNMDMENVAMKTKIAAADQSFKMQQFGLSYGALSVWNVTVQQPGGPVPNWVVGFMAALDDIEEGKHK